MKPWIKILIAGLVGFGGGFASGIFAWKKMNDVKFQEISEEEMAEIEKKVANDIKEVKESLSRPDEEKVMENIKKAFDMNGDSPEEAKLSMQGKQHYINADKEQKKAYEKLWNATNEYSGKDNADNIPVPPEEEEHPEEDDDEEYDSDDAYAEKENENSFVDPPCVISLAEFYNEYPEYDRITIDWYEPDDVWLDEKEEIIADISSYIGMEVKSLFASNTPEDDPDVRFIRNDRYGSMYEVIRHHRSWFETSGGVK